jgi:ribosome biogenesis GTPase A
LIEPSVNPGDDGILSRYSIQWYPGHIAKLERQLKQLLQPVDVVLEVLDARAPLSTRHPYLEADFLGHKYYGIMLNKTDLADPEQTSHWRKALSQPTESTGANSLAGVAVTGFSALQGNPRAIVEFALALGEPIRQKNQQKGLKRSKPLKLAILGMPNVGKSSLINRLVGKTKAKTGHQAGVTREPKWIQIHPELILLDTPGLIPPKLNSTKQGLMLACLHGIGEDAFDNETVAQFLLDILNVHYPDSLKAHYKTDFTTVEGFSRSKNLFLPGKQPDCSRGALRLLTDFRHGKLGRLSLEWAASQVDETT